MARQERVRTDETTQQMMKADGQFLLTAKSPVPHKIFEFSTAAFGLARAGAKNYERPKKTLKAAMARSVLEGEAGLTA